MNNQRKATHKQLEKARLSKSDEFYTQLSDINRELQHYRDCFVGKVVYCNCDNPQTSNFFRYFVDNFQPLGIKKLITSCYNKQEANLFDTGNSEPGSFCEYMGERDDNDGTPIPPKTHYFKGDGDFRSDESVELLKQADIVVTNPPFSLFREYVAQLIEYGKKFLIIGNINAITYKEIFSLIQDNKVWLGVNLGRGISGFIVPEDYELYGTETHITSDGKSIVSTNNCLWLTNLETPHHQERLTLTREYQGNEDKYLKYDNCDGINVNKTKDIPKDYMGTMGVPITFLHKYNPAQFEIVRFRKGDNGKDLSVNGKCPYFRILIRRKATAVIAAVFAVVGMAVAVSGCTGRGQEVKEERIVNVKVQTVEEYGDAGAKTYVGTVSPSKSTVLTARYAGTLVSLTAAQGQKVAKGDVLAVVESQSVQSSLEIVKARLEQARDGYERLKKVYASGSVPEVRLVEIETQLAEAEASFKIAQQALDDCTITAPYSGVVSEVYAEEGTEIGLAEPLLRVIDANSLEINIPVPENEIGGVTVGKVATMTVPALNDKVIGCRVTKKGVTASPLSHSYECTLIPTSTAEGLMPGMVCKVRLAGEGEDRVVIPASAVKTGADGRYVWVVEDGRAKRVNIAVDGFSGTGVVVTEGLAGGVQLIVSGAQKVSGGMKVNIVE